MYEPSKPPPYASMVIVEVFYDQNTQQHEVRFLFRNRTSPVTQLDTLNLNHVTNDDQTKPYVKHLLGKCGEFCSLEDFEHLTSHLRMKPPDWKSECDLVKDPVIEVRIGVSKICKNLSKRTKHLIFYDIHKFNIIPFSCL